MLTVWYFQPQTIIKGSFTMDNNKPKTSSRKSKLTLAQEIAQKEKDLAQLKSTYNELSSAQKVVIGGMVLSVARKNPQFANQLLTMIKQEVTRNADKNRLEDVVVELQEIINPKPTVLDNNEPSMSEQHGVNHG